MELRAELSQIRFDPSWHDLKTLYLAGAQLLDVRTIMEFSRTGIKTSRHIQYEQLHHFIPEIKSWNKIIITYSSHGRRSKKAAELLRKCKIKAINGGTKKVVESLLFTQGMYKM